MDRNFKYGAVVLMIIFLSLCGVNIAIELFNYPDDLTLVLGFVVLYLTAYLSVKTLVKIFRMWRNK